MTGKFTSEVNAMLLLNINLIYLYLLKYSLMQMEVILLPNEAYVCDQNREDYLSGAFSPVLFSCVIPCTTVICSLRLCFISLLNNFDLRR